MVPLRGQSGRSVRLSGPVRDGDATCSMMRLSKEIVLYRGRFQVGFGFEAQFEEFSGEVRRSVYGRTGSSLHVVCRLLGVILDTSP